MNTFFFNFLSKFNVKASQIFVIILLELLVFYFAMDMVALVLLIISRLFYNTPPSVTITLLVGIIIYLLFSALIIWGVRKAFITTLIKKIDSVKPIRKLFKSWIKKIWQQDTSTIRSEFHYLLISNKMVVFKAFLGQLLVISADALTLYALFQGLGINITPFVVILALVSTKIISLIPFLPGSLVLYESSMSFLFTSMGVPLGSAIIVTMVYRLLSFWFPIPIGLFLYRKWLKEAEVIPQSLI